MFIGNNSIKLNQATVAKAIEHWLNTQCLDALAGIKVTQIGELPNGEYQVDFEPMSVAVAPKGLEAV